MKNGLFRIVITFAAVFFASQAAIAATGQARLGLDARGRYAPGDFGFAFMDNVDKGSPQFDICTTVDRSGNDTLRVTDGVASPENPEAIMRLPGDTPSQAKFYGRTGDCYYMVTGASNGGEGGAQTTWNADFDTNDSSPHFVLYINERYCSSDDIFNYYSITTLSIEVANPASSSTISFRLSQQSSNNGKVDILQDDGITPEPIGADGKTERIYTIQPDPYASGPAFPNGTPVQVQVMGLDPGDVIITATGVSPTTAGDGSTSGNVVTGEQMSSSSPGRPIGNGNPNAPVITPPAIYHIVDMNANGGGGHSAVIIPNGAGCTYYSYGGHGKDVTVVNYNNITDALAKAKAANYTHEQHWNNPTAAEATAARNMAASWNGTPWDLASHNCWHMAFAAMDAGNCDVVNFSNVPSVNFVKNNEAGRPSGTSKL